MSENEQFYDEEIEIEAIGVEISSQPIELYKVFKIANVVSGGGEAKHIIAEGYVVVNGEIETRKRRKVYDGDLIEFNQEYYLIICDTPSEEDAVTKNDTVDKPHFVETNSVEANSVEVNKVDKTSEHGNVLSKSKKSTQGSSKSSKKNASSFKREPSQASSQRPSSPQPSSSTIKQRDIKSGRHSIDFF